MIDTSRVAVLHQAVAAPLVDGVRKPAKPGGYRDSGADIAAALLGAGQPVVTPVAAPNAAAEEEIVDEGLAGLIVACAAAGDLAGIRAPIRIDCRRGHDGIDRLFDLNMKPNLTGPGRPGRDDQTDLVAMAAAGIGWSYPDLLLNLLRTAWPIAASTTLSTKTWEAF